MTTTKPLPADDPAVIHARYVSQANLLHRDLGRTKVEERLAVLKKQGLTDEQARAQMERERENRTGGRFR